MRTEAAKRLKEIEKAEDAADEALLKFGTNIRNFLRDAVQIAPPSQVPGSSDTILFESKDASGKRVFHSTRFDAQLHVIHSNLDSFTKDPDSSEFEKWNKEFDVEKKTEDIARDLDEYGELRTTMEKLVPDKVSYGNFWKRYYFLRHSVETAEARRKDLLKGMQMFPSLPQYSLKFAVFEDSPFLPPTKYRYRLTYIITAAAAEEDIAWDEDSSSETEESKPKTGSIHRTPSTGSSRTLHPTGATDQLLKPSESRKSHDEKSQADSDTSYDMVGATSGAPSRAPDSPKESRGAEESEEEDWE